MEKFEKKVFLCSLKGFSNHADSLQRKSKIRALLLVMMSDFAKNIVAAQAFFAPSALVGRTVALCLAAPLPKKCRQCLRFSGALAPFGKGGLF